MEFTIDKKELIKGLERTLTVVERRNTMPSLNHALFEVKDGNVQISATDLEIFVTSIINCKTLTTGRMAAPARSVYDIVKECPDGEIQIKELDNFRLEITAGKSQFKLLGLSSETFPHFKTSPKGQLSKGSLNVKNLLNMIQKTEHSVCTEEIRYFLTGIYLETIKKEDGVQYMRAVSTDGNRLSLFELPESEIGKLEIKKGLIIPKKGASELRKLLESCTQEFVELTCDENLLRVTIDDVNLWIRPIDGEYPDYKRVIPTQLPAKLISTKKNLQTSLKRMSLLVSDRSRVVTFEFKKDLVILSTNNPDLGEAMDEVEGKYDGQEFKTGFNVRFFLDAVNQFDGENIEIEIGEKLQPALLRSNKNPGYLIVIMPMRI